MMKALKNALGLFVVAILSITLIGLNANKANAASFNVAAGYDEATNNGSCALTEALANINDQAQTYSDCPAGTGGGNDIINLPEGTITLVEGMDEVGVPFSVKGYGKDKSFIDGGGMNFVFKFNETGVTYFDYNLSFEDFSIENIDNGICISANNFSNSSNTIGMSVENVDFNNCWGGISNTLDNGTTYLSGVDMESQLGEIGSNSAGVIIFNTNSSAVITNSTFSGYPFGVYALPNGSIRFVNNTLSGNLLGAVLSGTPAEVYHNTIVGNSSDVSTISGFQLESSGLAMFGQSMNVQLKNNVIANNYLNGNLDNCNNSLNGNSSFTMNITSSGNLSDDTCNGKMGANDQTNIAGAGSKIGTLQNNGGTVRTMALLDDSEAIDNADDNVGVEVDARGVDRPQLLGFDIGAYERNPDDPETPINPEDPDPETPKPPRTGALIGLLLLVSVLISAGIVIITDKRRSLEEHNKSDR